MSAWCTVHQNLVDMPAGSREQRKPAGVHAGQAGRDRDAQSHCDRRRFAYRPGATLAVPKGPRGEQRQADAIGRAVHIARIAPGEAEDTAYKMPNKVRAGHAGARAQAASTMPQERSAIARKAAAARWENSQ